MGLTARKLRELKQTAIEVILSPYRFFKAVCFFIGLCVMTFVFALSLYAYLLYRSLPDLDHTSFAQLQQMTRATVVKKLEHKADIHPWIALDHISKPYLYAVVMSEDSKFFEHEGVNFDAMIESALRNLKTKHYEAGASTITQQVVKNLYLSNEKSIMRKLKEILIARRLERHFTKNQILEIYLNMAEFGPDIFGASYAAHYYFKKKPSQINAAEGAFIAVMLPSPRKFHYAVFENQNIAKTKKKKIRRVLGDLLANELISTKQYHKYLKYNYFTANRHIADWQE